MSRLYGDPVEVWTRDGEPSQFVWRDRLYLVRRVLDHWVVAREWIEPDDGEPRTIRLRIGLEERIDDLEIRAWLDWAEYMELSSLAMVRTGSGSRG